VVCALQVPVPQNTAKTQINVSSGRAKFEPEHRAIVWRIKRFPGGAEYMITADVTLMPSTNQKAWNRPPIQVGRQAGHTVGAPAFDLWSGHWRSRAAEGPVLFSKAWLALVDYSTLEPGWASPLV
jgi:hypothetical protein